MNKQLIQKILPHLSAVIIFLLISAIYFSPQLKGHKLHQHDKLQSQGMSKEIADFRKETGEEALWTNSAFGGMPAYQISVKNNNVIKSIKDAILKIIPRPIGYMFFLMIGFYILLLCFNVNPWLAVIGGIAFGLSSLNMLYLGGGHNAKIHAISFIPPIIGSIVYAYRKNLITGAALLSLFVSWHLSANHFQMTYYLLYLLFAIIVVELYIHIKNGLLPKFIKVSSILLIAGILGVLPLFSNLLLTYEYSKYTTRGDSELTISAEQNTSKEIKNDALAIDYIKQYSLGYGEVWSLVIPDIKGGKMGYLGNETEIMSSVSPNLKEQIAQHYRYWGEQASTGGALYFGASIFLLFILGAFLVQDKFKWALIAVSILAIILSWKYGSLVDWFIEHMPLFDKFRDTKMMLILPQLAFPLLGILFVNKLLKNEVDKRKFTYISLGVIGLLLVFYIMPSAWFSFLNNAEIAYFDKIISEYQSNPNAITQIKDWQNELINVRIGIFKKDCFRSLFFIISVALIIYLYLIKKLKNNPFIIILGVLILIDLWGVDKRYLNDDNFESKRKEQQFFQMTEADKYILKDGDPNFRVMNRTVNTFSDASTSYFHKSLGGYHGAKLKRYQEIIDFHISKNNMNVLNMLNTKYFILPDNNRQPVARLNPEALGNAWFVEDYRIVPNADSEILALNDFNPSHEAIIDARFEDFVAGKDFSEDSVSNIKLSTYKPNHLVFNANCINEKLAVFSEIYYPKGWNVYIDGEAVDYFRTNYILRGLVIPEGEHIVEFKFEPKSYFISNKVSMASSVILLISLLLVFGREVYFSYRKKGE